VALKRFVDDVVVEAIEVKLINSISDIFSPISVSGLPAELVTAIAGESEDSRAEREQLNRQLTILTKGSDICKGFIGTSLKTSSLGKSAWTEL
jgi:hypothetical protein